MCEFIKRVLPDRFGLTSRISNDVVCVFSLGAAAQEEKKKKNKQPVFHLPEDNKIKMGLAPLFKN